MRHNRLRNDPAVIMKDAEGRQYNRQAVYGHGDFLEPVI